MFEVNWCLKLDRQTIRSQVYGFVVTVGNLGMNLLTAASTNWNFESARTAIIFTTKFTNRWAKNVDELLSTFASVCYFHNKRVYRRFASHLFFKNICKPDSCLHHLLPPSHNTSVITRLRSSTSLPRPISRTKQFESFLNFALNKTSHLCNNVTQVFLFNYPLCYCYCRHCPYLNMIFILYC